MTALEKPINTNTPFSLQIDAMAYGGKGVGRLDGKVFFVLDAVVGDTLLVRMTQDSGRYADAEIVQITRPSELRGVSPCAYADACGGCQWQGINYDQQLAWKLSFVTSSLKRIAKQTHEGVIAIKPSPEIQGYRNRILLRARLLEDGSFVVGYFKRQSRALVAIDHCEIAAKPINAFIKSLLATKIAAPQAQKFRLEAQEVREQGGKTLVVTVIPAEPAAPGIHAIAQAVRELPQVLWVGVSTRMEDTPTFEFDESETTDGRPLQYKTEPGQFQQVNVGHNHQLRLLVEKLAKSYSPKRVLDVCCGSGNLSLPLISDSCYVKGVEANERAIRIAKKNMAANGLTNAMYLTGDGEKHLWNCAKNGESFDVVLLDPPRQGMHQGMIPLKKIAPKAIIYVSCDPTTLARDIGTLCRDQAYWVASTTAFDFFPNTYHVETVVELVRS